MSASLPSKHIIDLAGKTFDDWTVIEFSHVAKNRFAQWVCRCKCGTTRTISGGSLMHSESKSCGCSRLKGRTDEDVLATYVLEIYKSNAKRRGLELTLTVNDFKELIYKSCVYCGAAASNLIKPRRAQRRKPVKYNGLDRVDNSLGYTKENVVTCCGACNIAKNDRSEAEFLAWIEAAYNTTKRAG